MKTRIRVELDTSALEGALKKAGRKGLWSALDYLAQQSKAQVPLDQGTLKASCAVDVNADGTAGTVSYDTPYAVRWHEHDANFQRGRKKKYLEDPANDPSVQSNMVKIMQQAYHGEIGD